MKLVDRELVDGTKITIGRRVYYNYKQKRTSKYYAAEYRDDSGRQVCENLKVSTKSQARRKAIEIAQRLERGETKIVESKLTIEQLVCVGPRLVATGERDVTPLSWPGRGRLRTARG